MHDDQCDQPGERADQPGQESNGQTIGADDWRMAALHDQRFAGAQLHAQFQIGRRHIKEPGRPTIAMRGIECEAEWPTTQFDKALFKLTGPQSISALVGCLQQRQIGFDADKETRRSNRAKNQRPLRAVRAFDQSDHRGDLLRDRAHRDARACAGKVENSGRANPRDDYAQHDNEAKPGSERQPRNHASCPTCAVNK
jgi:hypothetical protein